VVLTFHNEQALIDMKVDLFSVTSDGAGALHCAAEKGHAKASKLLVQLGIDVEMQVRARWVTLRARWVTLRARWGMLRAR
jgi:ankyrin repeat protein